MLEALSHIPFLKDLSREQLELLLPLLEEYSCPAGTVIFEQGDAASHLYLILRGAVVIRYKPYDGPAIVLTRLRSGDAFGWSAVIGSKAYTSGIISEEEVETIRIRGSDLRQLCAAHPETGRLILDRLAGVVSSRWKDAHAQVKAVLDQGVNGSKQMRP